MKPEILIAITAGVVIVSVVIVFAVRFRRWPDGRKRAYRAKKRK